MDFIRLYVNYITTFWDSTCMTIILLDAEASKTTELNSVTGYECFRHGIKDSLNDLLRLNDT